MHEAHQVSLFRFFKRNKKWVGGGLFHPDHVNHNEYEARKHEPKQQPRRSRVSRAAASAPAPAAAAPAPGSPASVIRQEQQLP